MAVRTTTLRTQPELRWWTALGARLAAMRSARAVHDGDARESREPIRAHAFKDDPSFWLRSL